MKELKSKKTGLVNIYTDEEYDAMVLKGRVNMKNFIVTDLRIKTLLPTLKEATKEDKPKKKKNEG